MTRYRTIVADPPWAYDGDGFPSMVGPGRGRRRRTTKQIPYSTMSVVEIAALPVRDLSQASAALFLWTTNRHLPYAFRILEDWGYEYTQTIVWAKTPRSPFVASVAPNHAEYLLVARRGSHRWSGSVRTNVLRVEQAPQWAAHSAKPDAFLDLVEQVSPGPYLELFARRQRLGWDTWGNEALEHVTLRGGGAA